MKPTKRLTRFFRHIEHVLRSIRHNRHSTTTVTAEQIITGTRILSSRLYDCN